MNTRSEAPTRGQHAKKVEAWTRGVLQNLQYHTVMAVSGCLMHNTQFVDLIPADRFTSPVIRLTVGSLVIFKTLFHLTLSLHQADSSYSASGRDMHYFIVILFLLTGDGAAVLWQKLWCPHEPQHQNLLRVWCRRNSADCCTGLTFSHTAQSVDGGRLRVTQDSGSFSVEVLGPGKGGVFWCGVLSRNNTIIKLAEGYIHSSSAAFIWSFARWVLLPLLPMTTIIIYTCSKAKVQRCCTKRAEEPVSGSLADPESADQLVSSPEVVTTRSEV
ncbi:uncharacterized protein [Nothobranchius furzeri]